MLVHVTRADDKKIRFDFGFDKIQIRNSYYSRSATSTGIAQHSMKFSAGRRARVPATRAGAGDSASLGSCSSPAESARASSPRV